MASSPSTRIRAELQAAGENLNTWGAPKLNAVISRLEEAICGFYSAALSGNVTLTSANYSGDQAHMAVLNFSSGTGGTVTIPAVEKTYIVRNATSGAAIITTGSGSTATVVSGDSAWVISDATNVFKVQSFDFAGKALTSILGADFGTGKLTNLGAPTNPLDGVNKAYADALAMASFSGTLPAQGGNAGRVLMTNGSAASWQFGGNAWTAISSNVTLLAGSVNAVDTSAARALALPAAAAAGGIAIRVSDIKGLASSNNITVSPNGSDTMNAIVSDTLVIDVNYGDVTFVPLVAATGWQTVLA